MGVFKPHYVRDHVPRPRVVLARIIAARASAFTRRASTSRCRSTYVARDPARKKIRASRRAVALAKTTTRRRRRRRREDDDRGARSRRLTASPVRRAQRNIEIGRVALCNLKADKRYGKLLVIVDVVDMNRVRARDGAIRARDDADPNTRDPRSGDGGRATGTNERRTDDEIDFARDRRCSSPRRVSSRM